MEIKERINIGHFVENCSPFHGITTDEVGGVVVGILVVGDGVTNIVLDDVGTTKDVGKGVGACELELDPITTVVDEEKTCDEDDAGNELLENST